MKTGIIIANTGSPAGCEPDEIEAYLREFLMDPRICQMPRPLWRYIVYRHILPKRKFSSSERYKRIWTDEGSPLVTLQTSLCAKVQARFDAASGEDETLVRCAMSYGDPNIADVLAGLAADGCERIVLLPFYPQSAYSPTMAVVDAFNRARAKVGWAGPTCIIDNYHDHPGYIALIAESIREAGFAPASGDQLLLSLHAIPLKDERAGDTYRTQVAESARLIAAELGIPAESVTVGYQSVFGHDPSKWASPLSLDILKGWSAGAFRVFFCCPGFSIDCLETLYDIPYEMAPVLAGALVPPRPGKPAHGRDSEELPTPEELRAAGEASGRFTWVPCLNDRDEHADVVFDVLRGRIGASSFDD